MRCKVHRLSLPRFDSRMIGEQAIRFDYSGRLATCVPLVRNGTQVSWRESW
jgi:hypothetical protein